MAHDGSPSQRGVDVPSLGTGQPATRSLDRFGAEADDAALVTALAQGSHAGVAFGLLYARHADAVRAVCNSQLRTDRGSVEDLVQETFVRLLRHAAGIREPGQVLAWLRRTARRACADHRDRAYQRREQVTDLNEDRLQTGDFTDLLVHADRVERLLAQMDRREAGVLRAHYIDGLPVAEIAGTLGISVGATKTQLYRARQQGRRLLEAGRSMIPMPLLNLISTSRQIIKTAPAAPSIAAAALIPVIAAALMVPGPDDGRRSGASATHEVGAHAERGRPRDAYAETSGTVPDRRVDTRVSAAEVPPSAGAAPKPPVTSGGYEKPTSPTREVDLPVVGQVQTYEEPETPPDRHLVIAPGPTGELVGLRSHDEPADHVIFDAACEGSEPIDAVSCHD